MKKRSAIDPRGEFSKAKLGDRRLNGRLDKLAQQFERTPDRSIPKAMSSEAELEAAYRFFQNERVTLRRLVEPHLEATAQRAAEVRQVLVLHDTTELRFGGASRRQGLGQVANKGQGFYCHLALAVESDSREPLGVAGLLTFYREGERPLTLDKVPIEERASLYRESFRWEALVRAVDARMGELAPIHVMDREADSFELFAELSKLGARFVVRMASQRRRKAKTPDAELAYVRDLAYGLKTVAQREVRLSARTKYRGSTEERTHPTRAARQATLSISGTRFNVQPPRHQKSMLPPLELGVVLVVETNAPAGEVPIEWMLITNEPTRSVAEILAVVDTYRARWTVEEYFKVLKTGCAIERRQLETADALEAILGFFIPIAAKLLALRSRARAAPKDPASDLLSEAELAALRILARTKLPKSVSVTDALYAIAAIGGHLKRNGEPGWQTLSRGYEDLHVAAQVAAAFLDGRRSM